jgi:hypothetical protein
MLKCVSYLKEGSDAASKHKTTIYEVLKVPITKM